MGGAVAMGGATMRSADGDAPAQSCAQPSARAMAVSCKGTKQALIDCLKNSPCMQKGGEFQECMKRPEGGTTPFDDLCCAPSTHLRLAEDVPIECHKLRYAFFLCKRGQVRCASSRLA